MHLTRPHTIAVERVVQTRFFFLPVQCTQFVSRNKTNLGHAPVDFVMLHILNETIFFKPNSRIFQFFKQTIISSLLLDDFTIYRSLGHRWLSAAGQTVWLKNLKTHASLDPKNSFIWNIKYRSPDGVEEHWAYLLKKLWLESSFQ